MDSATLLGLGRAIDDNGKYTIADRRIHRKFIDVHRSSRFETMVGTPRVAGSGYMELN